MRKRKKKLYKFLGFYQDTETTLMGRLGQQQLRVYFKTVETTRPQIDWAGVYFIGHKEDFKFLTLTKEPGKKHYKGNILDIEFYLQKIDNPTKNKFDWIIWLGYSGKRKRMINNKVINYSVDEFIFSDTLE